MQTDKEVTLQFRLEFSIPQDDRNNLSHRLSAPEIGAQLGVAGAGPSDVMYLVATLVATTASVVQTAVSVATAIIDWRNRTRDKGVAIKVTVSSGNTMDSINLEVATDEQITVFIHNAMGVNSSLPSSTPSADSNTEPE